MKPEDVKNMIESCGGKVEEMGIVDDSGFAVASFPLRQDHWIYGDRHMENFVCMHEGKEHTYEPPPMPFRMGVGPDVRFLSGTREEFAEKIRMAGRYAVRASTMKGKDMDFDPDALIQNLVVGMLGYFTSDGLSSEEWSNPVR